MQWRSLLIVSLLMGCQSQPPEDGLPSSHPAPLVLEAATTDANYPRLMTLRLTLSSPEDLKVAQGDRITQGQILSDRVRDQRRIAAQLERLHQNLAQLEQLPVAHLQPRPLPGLPPASFLEQERAIAVQATAVQAIDAEIATQHHKLVELEQLEALPDLVLTHEQAVLTQLEQRQTQAIATLDYSRGQLATAHQMRAYQEYQHQQAVRAAQHELDRQRMAIAQQQQERTLAIAQIQTQIGVLNGELEILKAVRSPFDGILQRIQWVGQTDQALVVELTIGVDVAQPSPGPTPAVPGQ